jgi:hypothetical protein
MGTLSALRRAIAAAAVAASLAGCHVPLVSKGGSGGGAASTSVPASLNTCTIYAQRYDAEVIVTPGRTSECNTLITNLTGGGMVWAGTPNAGSMGDLTEQCDLTSSDGAYEAVVMDESGASVGHAACNGFETAGWTANTQAGPLARFVAAHQQTLLQQQATVAASAGQAQQVTSAQQALETDLTTLQSANSALTSSKSLTGAVNQMKRDYAQEQADYAREQHDSCPVAAGDATTVGQDSATVGGDLNTLTGDVENLQVGGIQSVQTAVSHVNSDLSTLQSLHAAPTVNPASAIAAGNTALASAWNSISLAQGQGKTIITEAQALAATAQSLASQHGC